MNNGCRTELLAGPSNIPQSSRCGISEHSENFDFTPLFVRVDLCGCGIYAVSWFGYGGTTFVALSTLLRGGKGFFGESWDVFGILRFDLAGHWENSFKIFYREKKLKNYKANQKQARLPYIHLKGAFWCLMVIKVIHERRGVYCFSFFFCWLPFLGLLYLWDACGKFSVVVINARRFLACR